MTTFSVICPLYGDGYKTLDKFFFHLDEQDYKKFEVILVHNSPDDRAKEAVKRALKTKVLKRMDIKEVDAGYDQLLKRGNHCRAFNVGAEHAKGKYLLFLDPDVYLYPGILREYKDAFDQNDVDFVYGDYDFEDNAGRISGRDYNEYQLRCANYISGAYPIKKESFKGWDQEIQSLQDWDMWLNAVDSGAKGFYLARPCFKTEVPTKDGISSHQSQNWLEVYSKVRNKHKFTISKTVVTSLGSPLHASNVAESLGCDVRVLSNILNFKSHNYENIYLLGFYPTVWEHHIKLFYDLGDIEKEVVGKNRIIHWIGTDIYQMQTKLSWRAWKTISKMLNSKDFNFIHLSECEQTQKELEELGIKSDVVPLPVKKRYEISPLPKDFTVGVYINPTQNMYFEDFMYSVADAMPDVKFKFFGDKNMKNKIESNKEWVGWVEMDKFLPTVSAVVRLTVHDGLPLGPCEAMMAGRNALASIKLPHALHAEYENQPDKADIIEKIRELENMPLNIEGSKYWNDELSVDLYKKRMSKYVQSK